MPTIFQKGDLLNTEGLHAFAHGCNAEGTMEAGVSLALKKRWPGMHEEVVRALGAREKKVGDVVTWQADDITIYSLVIQDAASKKAKMTALARALTTMLELAGKAGIDRVGMPRIGAGAAGLDFTRVKKLLAEISEKAPVTLVVFDQFVRAPTAKD